MDNDQDRTQAIDPDETQRIDRVRLPEPTPQQGDGAPYVPYYERPMFAKPDREPVHHEVVHVRLDRPIMTGVQLAVGGMIVGTVALGILYLLFELF